MSAPSDFGGTIVAVTGVGDSGLGTAVWGAVFPDIRPPVDEARWLLAGPLAVVTAAVVVLVGPRRLRAKVAETRVMLGAEGNR